MHSEVLFAIRDGKLIDIYWHVYEKSCAFFP
jgi:hypothetical protein